MLKTPTKFWNMAIPHQLLTPHSWTMRNSEDKTIFFFKKSKYLKNCTSVTWTGLSDLDNKSLSRVPNMKKNIWIYQFEVVLKLQIILSILYYLYATHKNDKKLLYETWLYLTTCQPSISEEWIDLTSNSNKY